MEPLFAGSFLSGSLFLCRFAGGSFGGGFFLCRFLFRGDAGGLGLFSFSLVIGFEVFFQLFFVFKQCVLGPVLGTAGGAFFFIFVVQMEFSFGDEYKDGPLALGLHKKNSTYDIVQMDDCYIVNDDLNKIVKYTVQFCKEAGLPYYKKMQHEGLLRHLVIRRSATNGDLLVNLVTTTQNLAALDLDAYVKGRKFHLAQPQLRYSNTR